MQTQRFCIKRDYTICCKLFAPDAGAVSKVLIGVHGFAGDKESSMLRKLAAAVCKQGAALLCFDFPAHGESPVAEEQLTVQNCKADLQAVMAYASVRYPGAEKSIFATSFGGYITLLCADAFPGVPLVLRAPAVTMPRLLLESVLKTSAEAFRNRETILCGFERPLRLPYTFFEDLAAQELLGENQVDAPVLIIHGDADDTVPLSDVQAFVKTQKRVTLEILHGANHRFKNPGEMEQIVELTKKHLGM